MMTFANRSGVGGRDGASLEAISAVDVVNLYKGDFTSMIIGPGRGACSTLPSLKEPVLFMLCAATFPILK
jgi:hypothetical protein